MKSLNEIPEFLYRAFTKEKYAKDFAERGQIRMGSIAYYTQIEDQRRLDITEGTARIKVRKLIKSLRVIGSKIQESIKPGNLDVESENLNCKYLLSCSGPEVDIDYMKKNFGEYIVKINDPVRLSRDVCRCLKRKHIPIIGLPEWKKVRYDKDLPAVMEPPKEELAELSFSQKDPKFAEEHEYRLVVITPDVDNTDCDEFLKIDLGQRLDYVGVL